MTVLELQEKRAAQWERMKEIVSAAEAEKRDLTQEEENSWDEAHRTMQALDKQIERAEVMERTPREDSRQIAGIETAVQGGEHRAKRDSEEYRAAVDAWLRWGDKAPADALSKLIVLPRSGESQESRALSVGSNVGGGYTVVPDETFASNLEVALLFFGGMRAAARTITTATGADLPMPTVNDTTNTGAIVSENVAFSTQDVAFSQVVMKAYKYTSNIVLVPWELLQDSSVDVAGYLAEALGTRIGRIQNTHFTIGTGPNNPTGLMALTAQGRAGATGTSTSVTWDDLLMLEHSVDIAYRGMPGVRWMFHDQTLRDVRRIKDGNGQYLWQPGVGQGAPSVISGYPYTVNNDMPVMAASVNSIAFGDLKHYLIRQVRDVQLLRLEELYAASGQVGFVAWARADGHLLDAGTNPVKHFTNSAS